MQLGHLARSNGPVLFAADERGWLVVPETVDKGPETLDILIRSGENWLDRITWALDSRARQGWPDERLAAPLAGVGAVVSIGLNYADHCEEFGVQPPDAPVIFTKLGSAVVGDQADIVWSDATTEAVDWEAELGVVIGREARNVAVEDALDAVFGYTIVNDITARDIQAGEQQWVRAKSLDTFCPVGPVVVPAADIGDPQQLGIRTRVNGMLMQDSSTAKMIFTVAELISRLSRSFTLRPGDLLATGTPLGVGMFREPPLRLNDGDVVEVEIDGIGTLTNRCRVISGGRP